MSECAGIGLVLGLIGLGIGMQLISIRNVLMRIAEAVEASVAESRIANDRS